MNGKNWLTFISIPISIMVALFFILNFYLLSLIMSFISVLIKLLSNIPSINIITMPIDSLFKIIPGRWTFTITILSVWGIDLLLKIDLIILLSNILKFLVI